MNQRRLQETELKQAQDRLVTLSERLLYALKTLGISQADLARRIGIKPQAIQYLCGSKAKKSSFTFEIAEALGISSSWLGCGEGHMKFEDNPETQFIQSQKRVPILEWKQIKSWIEHENIPGNISYQSHNWILTNSDIGEKGYAVRLIDKSMYPRFDQNTIAIINLKKLPHYNDFVIAYLKDFEDIVIRQYEQDPNGNSILKPINTAMYKTITITQNDEIWGVVIEARWQT